MDRRFVGDDDVGKVFDVSVLDVLLKLEKYGVGYGNVHIRSSFFQFTDDS